MTVENIEIFAANETNAGNNGIVAGLDTYFRNIITDANGGNIQGLSGTLVLDCEFRNTGSTAAGTDIRSAILLSPGYNSLVMGTYIDSWRGAAICLITNMGTVVNTIISNCKAGGIVGGNTASDTYHVNLINMTINGCTGDGIKLVAVNEVENLRVMNSIISNNTGYGINYTSGSTALNDRITRGTSDYNDLYNNTTAAYSGISGGAHNVTTDPGYVNAAGENFAITGAI